jgi:alkylation response protein AidB-like acyl-CoA dehydrogenase
MLTQDERDVIATVKDFVDRDVRPVVRELEHANEYPEQLIEQMKQLGIFGLAIPHPYGDVQVSMPCYALVTEELARGWMSLAGAMGGHTVVATAAALPAPNGDGRTPRDDGPDRARRRFGPPGDDDHRAARRR